MKYKFLTSLGIVYVFWLVTYFVVYSQVPDYNSVPQEVLLVPIIWTFGFFPVSLIALFIAYYGLKSYEKKTKHKAKVTQHRVD